MLITQGKVRITSRQSFLLFRNNRPKFSTTLAKKRDFAEKSESQQPSPLKLKVSNPNFARGAVAVLGLGFVDAGYSGDWSRIGVISKEIEDLLKLAAFLVVPLCIFIILSFTKDSEV